MNLRREAKFGLWVLAAVVIAAVSYYVGTTLKPGEDPYYIFNTEAEAYQAPSAIAATSPGGFTGFGETDGSNSRVVIGGRVIDKTDTTITLEGTRGQKTSLRFADSPRIFRLDEASAELLKPGVTVALRLNDALDTVESVLVISQP